MAEDAITIRAQAPFTGVDGEKAQGVDLNWGGTEATVVVPVEG